MGGYLELDSQRGLLEICSTISGADFVILEGFCMCGEHLHQKTVPHGTAAQGALL